MGTTYIAVKSEKKNSEKIMFGVKMENFDNTINIKIIKEVRIFTNLGPKEGNTIMEKALIILNHGITKEAENAVIENIKEVGVIVME